MFPDRYASFVECEKPAIPTTSALRGGGHCERDAIAAAGAACAAAAGDEANALPLRRFGSRDLESLLNSSEMAPFRDLLFAHWRAPLTGGGQSIPRAGGAGEYQSK